MNDIHQNFPINKLDFIEYMDASTVVSHLCSITHRRNNVKQSVNQGNVGTNQSLRIAYRQ